MINGSWVRGKGKTQYCSVPASPNRQTCIPCHTMCVRVFVIRLNRLNSWVYAVYVHLVWSKEKAFQQEGWWNPSCPSMYSIYTGGGGLNKNSGLLLLSRLFDSLVDNKGTRVALPKRESERRVRDWLDLLSKRCRETRLPTRKRKRGSGWWTWVEGRAFSRWDCILVDNEWGDKTWDGR